MTPCQSVKKIHIMALFLGISALIIQSLTD